MTWAIRSKLGEDGVTIFKAAAGTHGYLVDDHGIEKRHALEAIDKLRRTYSLSSRMLRHEPDLTVTHAGGSGGGYVEVKTTEVHHDYAVQLDAFCALVQCRFDALVAYVSAPTKVIRGYHAAHIVRLGQLCVPPGNDDVLLDAFHTLWRHQFPDAQPLRVVAVKANPKSSGTPYFSILTNWLTPFWPLLDHQLKQLLPPRWKARQRSLTKQFDLMLE